jgi:hypothetical protein
VAWRDRYPDPHGKAMGRTIVLVSYNSCHYLEQWKRIQPALLANGYEIVVVDNGSADGSAAVLDGTAGVRVIRSLRNLGFGRGVNIGLRACKEGIAFVANPDVTPTPAALRELEHVLLGDDRIGVAAPRLVDSWGTQLSCRRFYHWRSLLAARLPIWPEQRRTHLMADVDHEVRRDVDWVLGAAMMVRTLDWMAWGGFDAAYFMYLEDTELCLTVRRFGKRVTFCGDIVMEHQYTRASARGKGWAGFVARLHHSASMVRFVVRHRRLVLCGSEPAGDAIPGFATESRSRDHRRQ